MQIQVTSKELFAESGSEAESEVEAETVVPDNIMAPFEERGPLRVKEDENPDNKLKLFAEHWIDNLFTEGRREYFTEGGEHGVEEDYKQENVKRWLQEQLRVLYRDWNDQNDAAFMIHPKELTLKQSRPPEFFRLRFRGVSGTVEENDVQFQMVGMVPPLPNQSKAYPIPDLRRTQEKMRKHQNWVNFHRWYNIWTQKYPGDKVVDGVTPQQIEFMEPKPKPVPQEPKGSSGTCLQKDLVYLERKPDQMKSQRFQRNCNQCQIKVMHLWTKAGVVVLLIQNIVRMKTDQFNQKK